MLAAGRHYLRKQSRSTGVADAELIKIAVKSLGPGELTPFDPRQKIIEYAIEDRMDLLVDLSLRSFVEETASQSPAPRWRFGVCRARGAGSSAGDNGCQPVGAQARLG